MLELFSGSLILADQTMQVRSFTPACHSRACAELISVPQSQIGASWAPVAQLKPKEDDLQLGLCRLVNQFLPPFFPVMMTSPPPQLRIHDLHHRLLPNIHRRARCPCVCLGRRCHPSRAFSNSFFFHLWFAAQPLTLQQALFPFLVMWLARDPKLSTLSPPPFHWPCAAAAATAAMLLPRHAETAKGEKQD